MSNKKNYKIGICGSTSTGKTTLVNALSILPKFKNYKISTERSKYLRDLGVPLNNESTLKGQTIFLAERCSELLGKNLITDRTIIDVMAFTLSSKIISLRDRKLFEEYAQNFINEYDFIFYVPIDGVELEDNSIRDTDPKYRITIDIYINRLCYLYEYRMKNLIRVPPNLSVEERVKFILESIKNPPSNKGNYLANLNATYDKNYTPPTL